MKKSYWIDFDMNGHGKPIDSQMYESNDTYYYSLPENARIRSSITLYARWTAAEDFSVTVEGGAASVAKAKPGATVSVTATVPDGKVLDYWEVVKGKNLTVPAIENTSFTMPIGSVILRAVFKDKTYKASFDVISWNDDWEIDLDCDLYFDVYENGMSRADMIKDSYKNYGSKVVRGIYASYGNAKDNNDISLPRRERSVTLSGLKPGSYTIVLRKYGCYAPGFLSVTIKNSDIYAGKIELWLRGDVNYDGVVDASDLTGLARHVAKIEQLSGEGALSAADVDLGGDIDAADLTMLARHVAKIEQLKD